MLFSGARPNEVAQLRAQDVKQSTGKAWYLDLATVSEDGSSVPVKAKSSRRRIPVHDPQAEQIWQPRLVRSEAAERDIPSECYSSPSGPVVYSLRHNVRDALRRVSAPPDALRAIAGWSAGSKQASNHYGDPSNPDFYVTWVNAISYEGLDLSFLHR